MQEKRIISEWVLKFTSYTTLCKINVETKGYKVLRTKINT